MFKNDYSHTQIAVAALAATTTTTTTKQQQLHHTHHYTCVSTVPVPPLEVRFMSTLRDLPKLPVAL